MSFVQSMQQGTHCSLSSHFFLVTAHGMIYIALHFTYIYATVYQ